MTELEELKQKLKQACETLEDIRVLKGDPSGVMDSYLCFWLGAKRLAGDTLIDLGFLSVDKNGDTTYAIPTCIETLK